MVMVLEYAGLAIAAFSTLQRAEVLEPESPVRAALVFEPPPDGCPCAENTVKVIFRMERWGLPEKLSCIDSEQWNVVQAISESDAAVRVIHALAGCGKTALLQCLIHIYAE